MDVPTITDVLDDVYWKNLDGRRDRERRERSHAAMNRIDELSRNLRGEDDGVTEDDGKTALFD